MKFLFLFLATMPLLAQKNETRNDRALGTGSEVVNPGNLSTPPSDAIILLTGPTFLSGSMLPMVNLLIGSSIPTAP